jgi:ATP-dependent DNA helicase RecG
MLKGVDEIQLTVDNAVDLGRLEPLKRRTTKAILTGLGLIVEGKLLNAAVALYGKTQRLQSLYPQCAIRLARFRGKDRLGDFIDNRQYWGHAFALLRRAETFLLDHVPIAGRVVSGRMKREDRPLYPPRAAREVIANALCHRDYTIPGGAVSVAMYDDHLEIINTGSLHFDITPEKLAKPHQSRPWNPIIAGIFYRAGIIEQWGTGTLKVIDWCKDNSNPTPIWEEQSGSIVVTFRPTPGFASEATPQVAPQVAEEVARLLHLVRTPQSRQELLRDLGLRDREHFRKSYLMPALKSGLLERTIPDKPQSSKQRYRLTAKGEAWLRQQGRQ